MKSRIVASVALSALVLAGATGCTFITPQSTTLPYSASDGVNSNVSSQIHVRNALFVANEAGTTANFVGAIVNNSDAAVSVQIAFDGTTVASDSVEPGAMLSYGTADQDPLAVAQFNAKPGTMVSVVFSAAGNSSDAVQVPVLDGTLGEYSDLAP